MEQDKLSHLDKDGSANMVDISEKTMINNEPIPAMNII